MGTLKTSKSRSTSTHLCSLGFTVHSSAHFSFMNKTGTSASPELTAQILGPREGGEGRMLDIPPRRQEVVQGEPAKVSLRWRWQLLVASSPCLVPTSHPTPRGLPHARAPGPPSVLQGVPVGVVAGGKGPLHLHPYLPCPKPVGTMGWRGPYGRC